MEVRRAKVTAGAGEAAGTARGFRRRGPHRAWSGLNRSLSLTSTKPFHALRGRHVGGHIGPPTGNWSVRSSRTSEGIQDSDSTVTPNVRVAIGQHGVACVEWFAPICDDSSGVDDCGFPRWLIENGPYRTGLQFPFHAPADTQKRTEADVTDGPSSNRMRLASKHGDFERRHDGSAQVARKRRLPSFVDRHARA